MVGILASRGYVGCGVIVTVVGINSSSRSLLGAGLLVAATVDERTRVRQVSAVLGNARRVFARREGFNRRCGLGRAICHALVLVGCRRLLRSEVSPVAIP